MKNGVVTNYTLRPDDFGLKNATLSELKGGSAQENAAILTAILRGNPGPKRDMVLLNSAAALLVAGKVTDLKAGVQLAASAIDSGRALQLLKKMGANV